MLVRVEHTWPMGHRLQRHDGLCRLLHGHTYRAVFAFHGEPLRLDSPRNGMVEDFGVLRGMVRAVCQQLDHAMVLQEDDPAAAVCAPYASVVLMADDPTAENIAYHLLGQVRTRMAGSGVRTSVECASVTVFESDTTSAEAM